MKNDRKITLIVDRTKIFYYMIDHSLKKPQMRDKIGISQPTFLRVLGEKPVSIEVVCKIARAIGAKAEEVVKGDNI